MRQRASSCCDRPAHRVGTRWASWNHVEAQIRDVDAAFVERCVGSGMSSGGGLIAEVADPEEDQPPAGEKRKLIVESEFAQVMKVLACEGNSLSVRIWPC